MKSINKIFLNRAAISLMTIALSFGSSQVSHAEDIEIYNGVNAEDDISLSPSDKKPNVLFILDSSGSMEFAAAPYKNPLAYIPNRDYVVGNGSDDNLYIYDANNVYTGMFVPKADGNRNSCKAATDYIDANTNSPKFFNRAAVFYSVPETVIAGETTCEREKKQTKQIRNLSYGQGERSVDFDLDGGSTYSLRIFSEVDGPFRAQFEDDDGNVIGTPEDACTVEGDRYRWRDCGSGTVPNGATKLVAYATHDHNRWRRWRTYVNVELTTQKCTTEPSITLPATSSWQDEIPADKDSSDIVALECEADNGVHGFNDAAGNLFPAQTNAGAYSSSPTYSSQARLGLVWANFPERYIVSGNYHDYLQTSGDGSTEYQNAITLPAWQTPSVYCAQGRLRNLGNYFIKDGEFYQCQYRSDILRNSMADLLNGMKNTNVGLMQFASRASGGELISAVKDIDIGNNRSDLISAAMAVPAGGGTPLQGSLYDAYTYYAGLKPNNPNQVTDKTALKNPGSPINQQEYLSPIKNECQDNSIILFTDGEPSGDRGRRNEIRSMSGQNCGTSDGDCLEEAAYGLANFKVNDALEGDNRVYTSIIGFDASATIDAKMKATSNQGLRPTADIDSQYYSANDSDSLKAAFRSILNNVVKVENDAFVAPTVSVSSYNRLQSRDDLYYALFKPTDSPRWFGNVKKYKLKLNSENVPEIIDSNSATAVDDKGSFVDDSQSFWSDTPDGSVVEAGGFASKLDTSSRGRKLYASISTDSTDIEELDFDNFLTKTYRGDVDGINGPRDDGAANSDDIRLGDIKDPSFLANRERIKDWTLGLDVDQDNKGEEDDPNYYVAEGLHTTPYLLSFGSDLDDPKDVVFATTNQGMLHAIDGKTGYEKWAYIPDHSLFENLGAYYNDISKADHKYGLDGEIAFDTVRDPETNKVTKANLFLSQRRGGSKYFAVSVKDADDGTAPKKLWTIEGGEGKFERMGQSWAKPVKAKINYCSNSTNADSCSVRNVLVISGGYDPSYDDEARDLNDLAAAGVKGNAIYIIDNETNANGIPETKTVGDKVEPKILWMAGQSVVKSSRDFQSDEMKHSFPSQPTLVDADFDGVADLMFAVDISGKVWRFDFRGHVDVDADGVVTIDENDILSTNNNSNGAEEVSGGIIADLSGDNRRFYNTVDVSITPNTDEDVARYNIVTGSGYRAHPAFDEGTVNGNELNKLFVVFDRNLQHPKLTFGRGLPTGITYEYDGSTTVDISSSGFSAIDGEAGDISATTSHKHGFYFNLTKGPAEKLINPTLTNNYQVLAVSYSPSAAPGGNDDRNPCISEIGSSRLYQVNLLTGKVSTLDLSKPGLSPKPVIIRLPDENNVVRESVLIGTETFATTTLGSSSGLSAGGDQIEIEKEQEAPVQRLNWWEVWK